MLFIKQVATNRREFLLPEIAFSFDAQLKEYKGIVPSRSVVIPGSIPKTFAAGTYQVPCALIIGKRTQSTDLKTSLNEALREYNVAV
jgi:2,3,4,5-tetrahydropyridine-2-carboxylate N-succinyltransferase